MSVRRIDVPSGTLEAETLGSGPDLVFVHGFSLDRRMWAPQVAHFSRTFRVTTYDLRGFGASTLPDGDYEHGADLAAVLDALGIDRALLVGLSLGANVAMSFAGNRPERLSGLVLASPGLPGFPWKTERPPEAAQRVAKEQDIEAARRFWLEHELFANLAKVPQMQALVHRIVQDYSAWHWQSEGRGPRLAPLPAGLEGIAVPTLVISGDHDVEGYRDIARHIASTIPAARLAAVPEGGHMVNLDAAATFDRLLEDFAGALPPRETTEKTA